MEEVVNAETYNRLVRVLEINLGEFDPDNIRQIDDTTKNIANFNPGSLVWNTNNESLEVYSGSQWITITTPKINKGLSATGSVGEVTLKIAGATSISL
jgi:succinylglutamate desuccinylase